MFVRKYALLPLLIVCVNIAYAQHTGGTSYSTTTHRQFIGNLLRNAREEFPQFKSTIARERIIGQSTLYDTANVLVIRDSARIIYSGGKGSSFDYNQMFYYYNYPYNITPLFNYNGNFTKPQVLYDTFYHYTMNPYTNVYGFYAKTYSSYDGNTNLVKAYDIFADSSIDQNMSYSNLFNASNNITTAYWFNFNLGISDSAYIQHFMYSGSNLIADSTYQHNGSGWVLATKSYYTYDGSGNLIQIDCYANIGGTMAEQTKYVNTYDGSKRLLTVNTSMNDGTGLVPYVKDTFAYTGTTTFHTSWKEWWYDDINHYWAPQLYMTKHLNAVISLPDTVVVSGWDTLANNWVSQTKDVITYDTLKNPVKRWQYQFKGTKFRDTASYITTYYYGPYIGTGVEKIDSAPTRIIAFPNPATTLINLSLQNIPGDKQLQLQLVNMSGQVVKHLIFSSSTTMVQVPISELSPGIYWMMVRDETGVLLHRQAIGKQ